MLETKSYIEILETNIPNVSRNHQSKVTDWDWEEIKVGSKRERERSPLTVHFYFGKINFLILKMPRFYIGNFMIVFTVDGKNQFEN